MKSIFRDGKIRFQWMVNKDYRNVSSSRLNRSVGVDMANVSCKSQRVTVGKEAAAAAIILHTIIDGFDNTSHTILMI